MKRIDLLVLLLVAALIFCVTIIIRQGLSAQRQAGQLENLSQQVTTWRDAQRRSHARVTELKVERATFAALYHQQRDSLEQLFDTKLSRVRRLQEVSLSQSRRLELTQPDTVFVPKDTLLYAWGRQYFEYDDRWLDLQAAVNGTSLLVNYQSYDSLTTAAYVGPRRLFGKRDLFSEAVSHNPHSTIHRVRSVTVKEKPEIFTLGGQVGYGLTRFGLTGYVGAGVTVRLAGW